jgi:hypothetical protein
MSLQATHYEIERVDGGWRIVRVTRITHKDDGWTLHRGPDGMVCQMSWRPPQPDVVEEHRHPMLGLFTRKRAALLWMEGMK